MWKRPHQNHMFKGQVQPNLALLPFPALIPENSPSIVLVPCLRRTYLMMVWKLKASFMSNQAQHIEEEEETTKLKEVQEKATKRKKTTERKESDDETIIKTIINDNDNEDEDEETISGYEEDIKSKPPKLKESKMMNANRTQREERTSDIYTKNLRDTTFEKHGSKFVGKDQYMRIENE
jgi:hypothetical protein